MRYMKRKNKRKKAINKTVYIMFVVVLVAFSALYYKARKQGVSSAPIISDLFSSSGQENGSVEWDAYVDKEIGFSLPVPKGLDLNELNNKGGYIKFLRFIENEKYTGKSLSIGVTEERNEVQEANLIIKDFEKGGEVVLKGEQSVKLDGVDGKRYEFEPVVDDPYVEQRSILIVRMNERTYSISTTPVQADYVLKNFKFI